MDSETIKAIESVLAKGDRVEIIPVKDGVKVMANFQGNPKAEVDKLLQSGAMSQQELNQLQSMAKQFEHLFH